MPRSRRPRPFGLAALASALACNATQTDSPTTSGTTGDDACPEAALPAEVMACTPPGINDVFWSLDAVNPWFDTDEQCTVAKVETFGDTQVIDLDCPPVITKLELSTTVPHVELTVDVGTAVRVQYWNVPNGELQSGYFALRRVSDGALLAAGVDAPIEHVEIDPLQLDLRSTACELESYTCSITQRSAIELVSGADSVTLFDHNVGKLGDLTVLVGAAYREFCFSLADECLPSFASCGMHALILRAP